jgi:hypothetical protein
MPGYAGQTDQSGIGYFGAGASSCRGFASNVILLIVPVNGYLASGLSVATLIAAGGV